MLFVALVDDWLLVSVTNSCDWPVFFCARNNILILLLSG